MDSRAALRAEMERLGVTQSWLAWATGFRQATISKVLRGSSPGPELRAAIEVIFGAEEGGGAVVPATGWEAAPDSLTLRRWCEASREVTRLRAGLRKAG